ncbi:hypothetical protein C8J57DRAFT_1293105 [Mycena rebaudengoi]|nr:hypothetical protein C8J57DRAFT_1293105 [Mycena rebaudengoi]
MAARLLASLTPPPFVNPDVYDGLELFRWKFLVFRPALFQTEAYILAGLLFYLAAFAYGSWSNGRKANKWLKAHLPILEQQFSKPHKWVQDGHSDFFNFSTGRRSVASLHTIFALRPRHDFFQWAFQTLRTFVDLQYRPKDDLQLDFKLLPDVLPHDFVWAIVSKDELLFVKDDRWDLTFTKTSENPGIPTKFSVMTEFADVTDGVLKNLGPVLQALQDPKVAPYFRSLSVRPSPCSTLPSPSCLPEREKHVILSLSAPSPSRVADTVELLKKVREGTDKDIKVEAEREKKEEEAEALEAKKAAKRKAEEERIAKLSAADQKKVLERERKRSIRKQQGKVTAKK